MTSLAVCIRFVHLGSCALLVGAFAVLTLVARPTFRRGGERCKTIQEHVDRRLRTIAGWSVLAALVSGLLWLLIQTATMAGQSLGQAIALEPVSRVLTGTHFGRVWASRL